MKTLTNIRHIRAAYAQMPPFVGIEESEGKTVLTGFMPDMLKTIASWMNFTVTLVHEPNNQYGRLVNGSWNGMAGMLYRNEVDIALNPLLANFKLLETGKVFFTNPVTIEAFTMLSGKEIEGAGLFMYFSVLSPMVWGWIGITLVAVATASMFLYKHLIRSSDLSRIGIWSQYIWFFLTSMLRQGFNPKWMLRKSLSRISVYLPLLTIMWSVGISFLVMNVFQNCLVSMLTVVKTKPLMTNLEDFVLRKEIHATSALEIEIQLALQNSGIPLYDAAWDRLEHNLIPMATMFSDKILNEAEKGKLAMIHGYLIFERVVSERFEKKGTCNFHIAEHHFFPFPLVMGLRKSLPESFLDQFNYGITVLSDIDVPGKWLKRNRVGYNLCSSYYENSLKPLSVKNLYGVLALWSSGIIVSIIVLVCEIMKHKITIC